MSLEYVRLTFESSRCSDPSLLDTVFVLGVGRFLRMGVAGLSRLAMYEDMPNVDKLLDHCKVKTTTIIFTLTPF